MKTSGSGRATARTEILSHASHLSAPLNGYRLRLDHDLDLRHCTCRGGIRLLGAHIGGALNCAGAELSNDTGPALDADRLTADGGLFLRDGFTATGHGELGIIRLPARTSADKSPAPAPS